MYLATFLHNIKMGIVLFSHCAHCVLDMVLYQYFVEVVPTEVSTFLSKSYTYQYSVKDNMRLIDHHSGELVKLHFQVVTISMAKLIL